ncbi:PP2C family protein-serine/threonine phosphatase [Actinospongicola halichondriae]|uniref:PP2C family protein-serine/threonine phosphatase n=1 Tax=Actinospongicola halichondriae TaxID=3236844 RepID=UPI003D4CA6F5
MTDLDGPSSAFFDALLEDDPVELYETAPCGYVSIDADRTIIKANQTFCDWTGHRREDLIARQSFLDLLSVGDRIFWETSIAPALEMQGVGRELAVEVRCASGEALPVLLNLSRVEGAGNGRSTVRIAVFDARERRAYEHELLRARREAEDAAERSRQLAETLQRTLLPPSLPEIDGVDVAGVYHAAGDGTIVGGDFYDVFEISDGAWGVVLGDVCGKGAAAAVDTALARYTVRASAMRTRSPRAVLSDLHHAMEHSDTQGFCTAVYLRVRRRADGIRVSVSVGGHHLPLLVDTDGSIEEFGTPGALLGMLGPPRLHDAHRVLAPGETLVLFTDGVLEARRGDEFFGEDRIAEILERTARHPAQEVAATLADAAIDFQSGDARDDIAVLVLRATPPVNG